LNNSNFTKELYETLWGYSNISTIKNSGIPPLTETKAMILSEICSMEL